MLSIPTSRRGSKSTIRYQTKPNQTNLNQNKQNHYFFLPSFLPFFLHSFLHAFLLSFLPSFLPSFFPSFFSSFLPYFLPSFPICLFPSPPSLYLPPLFLRFFHSSLFLFPLLPSLLLSLSSLRILLSCSLFFFSSLSYLLPPPSFSILRSLHSYPFPPFPSPHISSLVPLSLSLAFPFPLS